MPLATEGRSVVWIGFIVAACATAVTIFQGDLHSFFKNTEPIPSRLHNKDNDVGISGGPSQSILSIIARTAFDWSNSTTPTPLSSTAVLMKMIITDRSWSTLPSGLREAILTAGMGADVDGNAAEKRVLDVYAGPVRDFVSARVLREIQALCASSPPSPGGSCDPNEVEPEFGITPVRNCYCSSDNY